jgi:hypothetical protein
VKAAPVSASGVAVNDEVQITALLAGQECTVTLSITLSLCAKQPLNWLENVLTKKMKHYKIHIL